MTDSTRNPKLNDAVPPEVCRLIADFEAVLGKAGNTVNLDVTQLHESMRQKIAIAKALRWQL
jgi:hypothetical protein